MPEPAIEVYGRTVERPDIEYEYDVDIEQNLDFDVQVISVDYLEARPSRAWRNTGARRFLFTSKIEPEVVDAGEDVLFVPLIGCSAPELDGARTEVSLTCTDGRINELNFTLFGTGPTRSLEPTVTSIRNVIAVRGESTTLGVLVPILWRQVRHGRGSDSPLDLIVEPAPREGKQKFTVAYRDGLSATQLVSRQVIDTRDAPASEPTTHDDAYERSASTSMQLGSTIESIGLQVALTMTVERSITVDGNVTTPAGHVFVATWLAGPPSLALTLN